MAIWLIRHGTTEANERHLYCGSTDLPLSPAGLAALEPVSCPATGYVISGMLRTRQTLQALFGDVGYTVEPGLREIDFGKFEMHSYEELKDDPDYIQWISGDNESNVPPGGESGIQMTQRVMEAYGRVPDGSAVITHGGVIAAIMATLFPEEGKNRYQWQPRPGHGYVIRDGGYEIFP